MNIYKFSIPVTGYYPESHDFQDFYIKSEIPITREMFLSFLEKKKEKDFNDFNNNPELYWNTAPNSIEAFDLVNTTKDFPYLGTSLVRTSCHINHPRYGSLSFSCELLEIYSINE